MVPFVVNIHDFLLFEFPCDRKLGLFNSNSDGRSTITSLFIWLSKSAELFEMFFHFSPALRKALAILSVSDGFL
jgi:hypothetical protein